MPYFFFNIDGLQQMQILKPCSDRGLILQLLRSMFKCNGLLHVTECCILCVYDEAMSSDIYYVDGKTGIIEGTDQPFQPFGLNSDIT